MVTTKKSIIDICKIRNIILTRKLFGVNKLSHMKLCSSTLAKFVKK